MTVRKTDDYLPPVCGLRINGLGFFREGPLSDR